MKFAAFLKKYPLQFLTLFFILLSLRGTPNISGDGTEYLFMTEAITQGKLQLNADVVNSLKEYAHHGDTNTSHLVEHFSSLQSPPFFKSFNGDTYSYHFWLYSLFSSPAYILCKLLKAPLTYSFLLTNIIFTLIASLYISKAKNTLNKPLLLTLFFTGGLLPYIYWPHPEVFTTSLLLIAIILLDQKRFLLASFFAALAGQQNPPVLIVAAIALIIDAYFQLKQDKPLKAILSRIPAWTSLTLLSCLSFMFFFYHFGTISLIAASGYSDSSLISINRIQSLYFDLNQGIILALFPAFIAFILILFVTKFKNWGSVFIYTGLSVLLTLPSLSAPNWNSGAELVMRYGVWCAIPLSYLIARTLKHKIISTLVICLQCLLTIYYVVDKSWYRYTQLTPISKFALNHFPSIYNPIPEIFIERGQGNEGVDQKQIYLYIYNETINKVLAKTQSSISLLGCDEQDLNIKNEEDGWLYLNPKHCKTILKNGFHVGP